jgi:hypothetical protein
MASDSDIEPEMRIREADLDRSSAAEATRWLGGRIARGELDGEFEFGVSNRLNVILGHALRQQARRHATHPPSVRAKPPQQRRHSADGWRETASGMTRPMRASAGEGDGCRGTS